MLGPLVWGLVGFGELAIAVQILTSLGLGLVGKVSPGRV